MANVYNDTTGGVTSNPSNNTLSAFFDSSSDAENAVKRLKHAGIPDVGRTITSYGEPGC